MKNLFIPIILAGVFAACGEAPDAEVCDPQTAIAELYGVNTEASEAPATFEPDGDATRLVLDASFGGLANAPSSSYAYIDLDTESLLALSDAQALSDDDWDIAFNRSNVRLNSGDSGPGSLSLARMDGVAWEDAEPPAGDDDWLQDDVIDEQCEEVTFGQGFSATAFGQWYDYDFETHTASANPDAIFFIRDDETGDTIKLQFEEYTDGVYTLRWQ